VDFIVHKLYLNVRKTIDLKEGIGSDLTNSILSLSGPIFASLTLSLLCGFLWQLTEIQVMMIGLIDKPLYDK
jgi:hypothetical protein